MRNLPPALLVFFLACGPVAPGLTGPDAGRTDAGVADSGVADSGVADSGVADAGGAIDAGPVLPDLGWRFIGVPGSQCALGAQAGLGYNPGANDELMIFLQGGGACWNNGTCQPSLHRWGPVCNYGSDSICAWDDQGGTKPLAANVAHPDPFPADGGGVFPAELATVKDSLLFNRHSQNPLRNASYVYVPYCTGDLHAGDATRTYFTKGGLFDPVVPRVHHFAGATNMDAYLTYLRTRHPSVRVIWLTGVSGGGYGASLNVARVRAAFPEAKVHLLADSAPMVQPIHFAAWKTEWNLQLPANCPGCDAGMPEIIEHQIDGDATARVALLSYAEDQVITRFMYSSGTTASWFTPPYATYTANLVMLENRYEATPNARFFRLAGQSHVMLQGYGVVQSDGGISAPFGSPDGGTTLKRWIDAWATGSGPWENVK